MSLFLGLGCLAIAIGAIVVILQTAIRPVRKQRKSTYNPYDEYGRTPQLLREMARLGIPTEKPNKKKVKSSQSDSPKYTQLLRMLNGDRETADRLVSAYGVDKAISDLEKDRRIY